MNRIQYNFTYWDWHNLMLTGNVWGPGEFWFTLTPSTHTHHKPYPKQSLGVGRSPHRQVTDSNTLPKVQSLCCPLQIQQMYPEEKEFTKVRLTSLIICPPQDPELVIIHDVARSLMHSSRCFSYCVLLY